MSYSSDLAEDAQMGEEAQIERRYEEWKEGYHTDRNGKRHDVYKMDIDHLRNTIKLFSNTGWNTRELEKVLILRTNRN